jgi:hypothetical protein
MGVVRILEWRTFISLNSVNQLIFVMAKCGVFFEVRTEFLNIKYTSFSFRGLMWSYCGDYRSYPPAVFDIQGVEPCDSAAEKL